MKLLRRLGLLTTEPHSTTSSEQSEPTLTTSTLTTSTLKTSSVSLADEPIWNQMLAGRRGETWRNVAKPLSDGYNPFARDEMEALVSAAISGREVNLITIRPMPIYYVDPDVYGVDLGSYVETYPTEDEARTAAKQQDKPFVVKDGDDPLADFLAED